MDTFLRWELAQASSVFGGTTLLFAHLAPKKSTVGGLASRNCLNEFFGDLIVVLKIDFFMD